MQNPFKFNLDKIDCFNNGFIYATSADAEQNDKLKDLFYGIMTATSGGIEENINFCPHLTLVRYSKNLDDEMEALSKVFTEPLTIFISTINLFRNSKGCQRRENMGYFNLGDKLADFEYIFSTVTMRASINS